MSKYMVIPHRVKFNLDVKGEVTQLPNFESWDDLRPLFRALARTVRYNGLLSYKLNVLRHSRAVGELIRLDPLKLRTAGHTYRYWTTHVIGGYLHDLTEALIGDVPRPVKSQLPELARLEGRIADSLDASLRGGVLRAAPYWFTLNLDKFSNGLDAQSYCKIIKTYDELVFQCEVAAYAEDVQDVSVMDDYSVPRSVLTSEGYRYYKNVVDDYEGISSRLLREHVEVDLFIEELSRYTHVLEAYE